MFPPEEDDAPLMMDLPPSQPVGQHPVQFTIPIPTIEQVAGEMARQLLADMGYGGSRALRAAVETAIAERVNDAVERRAVPLIEAALDKPMQPTDNFGNPVGQPVTLAGFIAQRVEAWVSDVVDADGKVGKPDNYNRDRYRPRIDHIVAQAVNSQLLSAVKTQTDTIIREVKARGEKAIAATVAERIAGLIIKSP